jgi:hypothetical protein
MRVKRLLAQTPGKLWRLGEVARQLVMGEDTLQRHLTQDRSCFRDLPGEVRMEHALFLLWAMERPLGSSLRMKETPVRPVLRSMFAGSFMLAAARTSAMISRGTLASSLTRGPIGSPRTSLPTGGQVSLRRWLTQVSKLMGDRP